MPTNSSFNNTFNLFKVAACAVLNPLCSFGCSIIVFTTFEFAGITYDFIIIIAYVACGVKKVGHSTGLEIRTKYIIVATGGKMPVIALYGRIRFQQLF